MLRISKRMITYQCNGRRKLKMSMSNLMAYKMNKLDMARTIERIEHFHKKKWDVSGVLLAYIFRPWHLVMPFDTKSYIKQML